MMMMIGDSVLVIKVDKNSTATISTVRRSYAFDDVNFYSQSSFIIHKHDDRTHHEHAWKHDALRVV